MQLTEDFDAAEFNCKHCGASGIKFELVQALQELRDLIGKPIVINSGYRCPKHPIERRKARPGTHAMGIAADIRSPGMTPRALYEVARTVPQFKGFGCDDRGGYLHVDMRSKPARWCYRGGRDVAWFEV